VRPVAKAPIQRQRPKKPAAKRPMTKASLAAINASATAALEASGDHAHEVFVECTER
jgi:hypothetical protein